MEHVLSIFVSPLSHAIHKLLNGASYVRIAAESNSKELFGIDMSIEGLRSQSFSEGIFFFLILSLILFSVIIYFYIPKKKGHLKTGEKYMFGAIILGMLLAVAIGWVQLVEGYLI